MEITLSRVVEAARQRRAAVTAEAGGYIVLQVLQRLAASPRQVTADHVGLTAAGEIELAPSPLAEAREVETELRSLLALLLALAQSAPPALKATSERASLGDLAALEAELGAALIPINHAAQGRALARLFRETHKASSGGSAAPSERESSPLPSVRQASAEATPTSSRASVVSALIPPTPRPADAATPTAPPAVPGEPLSMAPTPLAPPLRASLSTVPVELAELAIDVEIVLSEADVLEGASSPAADAYADIEVLLAGDELDELLEAEVPAGAPAAAVELEAPAMPLAAAGDAAVMARADPIFSAPSAVSELSVSPLPPPAEPRLELLPDSLLARHEAGPEPFESPLPAAAALAAYGEPEPPPQRSDLRELLKGYLAHTRCEEHMTADLRRRIGLEPWRVPSAALDRPELGR